MFREFSPWAFLIPVSIFFLPYKAIRNKSKDLGFIALFLWVILLILILVQTKRHWYVLPLYIPLAYSCTLLMINFRGKIRYLREFILAVSLLQILLFNFITPALNLSLKRMSPVFHTYLSEGDTLTAYKMEFPALYFYTDRSVEIINNDEEFKKDLNTPDHFFIMPSKYYKEVVGSRYVQVLANDNKHVFFKTSKLSSNTFFKNINPSNH